MYKATVIKYKNGGEDNVFVFSPSKCVLLIVYVDLINKTLSLDAEILTLAKKMCHKKSLIVMGRGFNFATCLEGALVRACLINIILLQQLS